MKIYYWAYFGGLEGGWLVEGFWKLKIREFHDGCASGLGLMSLISGC